MSVSPFGVPNNYNEMLNKLGYSLAIVLAITFIVINQATNLIDTLVAYNSGVFGKLGKLDDYLLPEVILAMCVALIFRMMKLHDRISDLFGIREQFDIDYILLPIINASGYQNTDQLRQKLKQSRKDLMSRVFYKYASFIEPQITKHLISSALESWHWFWICLESAAIWFLSAIFLAFAGFFSLSFGFALASLAAIIVMIPLHKACIRNAGYQVSEITENPARAQEIKTALANEL